MQQEQQPENTHHGQVSSSLSLRIDDGNNLNQELVDLLRTDERLRCRIHDELLMGMNVE